MLNELPVYYGLPARIVTDRGTAFTSKSFADYCSSNGIQHIKNAVRTPRGKGQVERINEMIATFLRASTEDSREWDTHIRKLQWIVNNKINNTIGCCPNDVVFKYRLRDYLQNRIIEIYPRVYFVKPITLFTFTRALFI